MKNPKSIKYALLALFLVPPVLLLYSELNSGGRQPLDKPVPAGEKAPSPPDSVVIPSIIQQAEAIGSVNSLLINRKGETLVEEYFHGMVPGRTVNLKSASKSILGLLAGIAVNEGYIDSVNQPVHVFFPEYFNGSRDSLKRAITVKDLLTMRTGLETTSFHNYGRWVTSSNWVRYALDQPLVEEPGGKMVYSTGTSHLLSAIITRSSGMSTRQFAIKYLFNPLEIEPGGWDRDPQGIYMGGNNMALKPADMMKIGHMLLNEGTWEGREIIPMDWLVDSFKTYTRSNYNPYDYGYMWWKKTIGGRQAVFAWGYGGQYIFLFPELDSIVVLTSSLEGASQRRRYKDPVFELVEEIVDKLIDRSSGKS